MSEWRDVRVPATIRGYTDRPQGTVRARRSTLDHQTDPSDPLGAVSGRSELPDGRYARMSQIDQVNIVPCFRLLRQPRG